MLLNFYDKKLEEFWDIVNNKKITTLFQPIISLQNGEILGYEGLTRGPENSFYYSPKNLFTAAVRYKGVWQLDYICRVNAIEKAKDVIQNKLLFININPDIIKDPKFKKGFTRKFLLKNNLDINNIVFEITEDTAVKDYSTFNKVIDNYRQQGYKIAVDDLGEGYSGLKLMTEVRPHFVKIDMSLIRGIDKDIVKKELLKAFNQFSKVVNIQIIAEGIETYEELKTLIKIGIPYGQGYYIQKPAPSLPKNLFGIVGEIKELNSIYI